MAKKTTTFTPSSTADDSDREHRIRQIAYQLWEEEGYPHGRAEAHWDRASAMLAASEPVPGDAMTAAPRRKAAAAAAAPEATISSEAKPARKPAAKKKTK